MNPRRQEVAEDSVAKQALRLVLLRDLFSTGLTYHVTTLTTAYGVSHRTINRDIAKVSRYLLPLESRRSGWWRRIDFDTEQPPLGK